MFRNLIPSPALIVIVAGSNRNAFVSPIIFTSCVVPVIGAIVPVAAAMLVVAGAVVTAAAVVSTFTAVVSAGFFSPPAHAPSTTAPSEISGAFDPILGLLVPCKGVSLFCD